jgi:hypothetical protein
MGRDEADNTLPIGTAIEHPLHGQGTVRGRIGRKFVSVWFAGKKRAVKVEDVVTREAKEAEAAMSRAELALAEQLAESSMPPGCKVWHPQFGDGYVSGHYGNLTLAHFSGRSRAVPVSELVLARDKPPPEPEPPEPALEPSDFWNEEPATGWRPPPDWKG